MAGTDDDVRARLAALVPRIGEAVTVDPRHSLALALEAEALAERIGDQPQAFHARTMQVLAHVWLSDIDAAAGIADRLQEEVAPADPEQVAKVHYVRGTIAQSRGDEPGALVIMLEGLRALAVKNPKASPVSAALHSGAGNVLTRLGDQSGALEHYAAALALREELGSQPHQVAVIHNNIGMAHRELREVAEAVDAFQRALALFGRDDRSVLRATVLGNLGLVLAENGRAPEGVAPLERALALCEAAGYARGLGTMRHNLGLAAHRMGDLGAAEAHFARSLELRQGAGEAQDLAETRIAYAGVLHEQGRDDEALALLDGLVEGPEATAWLRLRADTQHLLYRIYRTRGDLARALDCHVAFHELSRSFVDDRARQRQQALAARFRTEQLLRERDRSRLEERMRLAQDMHDGFGSQLASARILIERGEISQQELTQTLRECMADLYLVVDILGNEDASLADAMADFRFRSERRLDGLPVQVAWRIDLDAAPPMSQKTILDVMRIVQEGLNNALRHAQARRIEIAAACDAGGALEIRVADDGRGIGEPTGLGRGVGNMRRRAREIGGELEIGARDPGTLVTLRLRQAGADPAARTPASRAR